MKNRLSIAHAIAVLIAGGVSGGGTLQDAAAAPVADFSLTDENSRSARYGHAVAPAQYRQQVSVWYFGSAT